MPEIVEPKKKIWECKIGEVDAAKLPPGADLPMRRAIEKAYHELTGEWPEFLFSGWGGELDDNERHVVNGWLEPTLPDGVDAVLTHAEIISIGARKMARGVIQRDRKRRFRDGVSIRTSFIVEGPDADGVIKTLNSVYKLEMANIGS